MDKITPTFEWLSSEFSPIRAVYPVDGLSIILGLFGLYLLYILIYGLFFCRTRHIPGPFLARFGTAYYQVLFFRGSMSKKI
jgi:hypothetical protein